MHHVGAIVDLIHESLYEAFSYERMDLDSAASAYGSLLSQLGIGSTDSMVYATTNYDLVGEYVIERLGGLPDWGEQRRLLISGSLPFVSTVSSAGCHDTCQFFISTAEWAGIDVKGVLIRAVRRCTAENMVIRS